MNHTTHTETELHDGMNAFERAVKRCFDVLLDAVLLLLLSPVILVISLRIKRRSVGPVFFRQERIGYRGRPFRIVKIGLRRPRAELFDRINRRVLRMMDEGLLDEVRSLLPHRRENALNTVGYKELFAFLDGKFSLDEAVRRIQKNTRVYAKKQMTWFQRDPNIHWFHPDQETDILDFVCQESQQGG